jgi:hypothetical protein
MVNGPDATGLRRSSPHSFCLGLLSTYHIHPVAYYRPRKREELETAPGLVVPGEDPEAVIDREHKPTRMMTEFSVFDVNDNYAMATLDEIEQAGAGRRIEAAGYVMAAISNEEDAGQEDEGDEELMYMRLGKIKRYKIDYGQLDELVIDLFFISPGTLNFTQSVADRNGSCLVPATNTISCI